MKSLMAALLALGLSTQAFAATLRIDCNSESDPDFMNVAIYQQEDGKIFGFIQQYYGDGDDYAEDVIEMKRIVGDQAETFVQVPGKYPKSSLAKKASHKVTGAVVTVTYPDKAKSSSEGSLVGLTSPSGDGTFTEEGMTCKRVAKFEKAH